MDEAGLGGFWTLRPVPYGIKQRTWHIHLNSNGNVLGAISCCFDPLFNRMPLNPKPQKFETPRPPILLSSLPLESLCVVALGRPLILPARAHRLKLVCYCGLQGVE